MKYKIKIDYTTGNSLISEREIEFINIEWENIDIAKENLIRIKEHYLMSHSIDSFRVRKKTEEILLEHVDKVWFVNNPLLFHKKSNSRVDEVMKHKYDIDDLYYIPDQYPAIHSIKLLLDNGNTLQYSVFWVGVFESLHSAEIVFEDEELKITFD